MATTGLESFDKTLHLTHTWLNDISGRIGLGRQHAWHALGAVLQVLRDRLPPGEAAKIAAELPLLIRGLYYEGYKPESTPLRLRTREDFLQAVTDRYGMDEPADPEVVARAVLGVMASHVSGGETRKIRQALPDAIADLWPAAGGEETPV